MMYSSVSEASRALRWGLLVAAPALAVWVGGDALATPRSASPFQNLELFAQALVQVEGQYVDPVDQDALVQGAIRGMMQSLDPHSTFLDPQEYRLMLADMEGRFAGVGIEVSVRDGWLTVLSVFEGGPAERAGLRPGDRFLHVEGRRARDMRIEDAVRLIRGQPGTAVRVGIRREGAKDGIEVSLTRAVIDVPAVRSESLPGGVLYLRIGGFSEKTAGELRLAIDRAMRRRGEGSALAGLLIDLRDNGGGLLDQAIRVSDEFISEGVLVSARGRDGRLLNEARAHREGTRPNFPIVVLVNQFSASAAEIVAGALRDHGRALLVGTRTWGKGSVQQLYPLPDGSAVKLTIARYYTPSGRSIQAHGIEPDRVVEAPPKGEGSEAGSEAESFREERLSRHLAAGATQRASVRRPVMKVSGATLNPERASSLPEKLRDDVQALAAYAELLQRIAAR